MTPDSARRFLVRPRPNPRAKVRLFCFPHAGIGASTYRPWSTDLPMLDVVAIQPPGRESRINEPSFQDYRPYVDAVVPAIQGLVDLPFAFFGHSLGALIAFETCRTLRAHGLPMPFKLFVSGRRAPHLNTGDKGLSQMSDKDLLEELRNYGGTPEELLANEELMSLMLPIVRADFRVHEAYVHEPGEPLNIPMAAFGGIGDPEVPREHIDAWRQHTSAEFLLRMLPGEHFFVLRERALVQRAILTDLASRLGSG